MRRLTRGNGTSVWVLRSIWLDTEQGNPSSPVTEVVEYRVLSSTGLQAWAQPDGWSTAADSTIALPWMCTSVASPEEHVCRSKVLMGTWSGKTMVGIDMAARKSMASWPAAATTGNWRSDESSYLPNWYATPNYETVAQRLAEGTGQSIIAGNSPVPFWWQASGNAVYDKRARVFYPPPRGDRPPVVENARRRSAMVPMSATPTSTTSSPSPASATAITASRTRTRATSTRRTPGRALRKNPATTAPVRYWSITTARAARA